MNKMTLITGGCRSGKSRHALELGQNTADHKMFVATAQALDTEMSERIEKHKKERSGKGWNTFEEPFQPTSVLVELRYQPGVLVLDCLTFWVSNLLLKDYSIEEIPDEELRDYIYLYILNETNLLMAESRKMNCQLIFVTNEVGSGIVPVNKMAREFRDIMGSVNQIVAEKCDEVIHMVCGIPTTIKKYEQP